MNTEEFIKKYKKSRIQKIQTVRIINDIEKDEYKKIRVYGDIKLSIEIPDWNNTDFLYHINNIGMMFSDTYIHLASKDDFESLDEFMFYSRIVENDSNYEIENLIKYPFKQSEILEYDEFVKNWNLFLNIIFMNDQGSLIDLQKEKYMNGYFYFNEPSIIVMGCETLTNYMAFAYNPYI